jgi:hypothetical protein
MRKTEFNRSYDIWLDRLIDVSLFDRLEAILCCVSLRCLRSVLSLSKRHPSPSPLPVAMGGLPSIFPVVSLASIFVKNSILSFVIFLER